MLLLGWLLAALVAGSLVCSILTVIACRRYLSLRPGALSRLAPVSILKPLSGLEDGLETNLRGFFNQDYPEFEILFTVRHPDDAAVAVVEALRAEYPAVPSRLIVTGEPPYPNHKVYCLNLMMASASHSLLAMSDSDVRVTPGFLRTVAAEFQDSNLSISTCPYRAVPGPGFWSSLEALMMNTQFLAGILMARMIEGMRFAVGPTIVARREAILAIGGWDRVKDYLAEDFALGRIAAEKGLGVGLSSYIVEHHIASSAGSSDFAANARHRLRWRRSTRRSRPLGYLGEIFTFPVPLAVVLALAAPAWWPLSLAAVAARAAAAWSTAGSVLSDPLCARRWWLIAPADIASFAFWIGGFFGNTITWRGHTYHLRKDGTFDRIV